MSTVATKSKGIEVAKKLPTPAEYVRGIAKKANIRGCTSAGLRRFGLHLRKCRERVIVEDWRSGEASPIGLRPMAEAIFRASGYNVSKDTLNLWERGLVGKLDPFILQAIASVGYVTSDHEAKEERIVFNWIELLEIASGDRDPKTGVLLRNEESSMTERATMQGLKRVGNIVRLTRLDLKAHNRTLTRKQFCSLIGEKVFGVQIPVEFLKSLEDGDTDTLLKDYGMTMIVMHLTGIGSSGLIHDEDGRRLTASDLIAMTSTEPSQLEIFS